MKEGLMLRFLSRALLACGLCLASSSSLRAEEADGPERLKLARSVVVDSGLVRSFHGLVAQMEEDMQGRTAATRPELAADLQNVLGDLKPEFDGLTDAMTDRAAQIYAARLSRRELADCAVFFAGPSGKAYVAAQPALIGDLAGALSDWRRETSITIMSRVREKMRDKGRDF
jgi:hypothetical protein